MTEQFEIHENVIWAVLVEIQVLIKQKQFILIFTILDIFLAEASNISTQSKITPRYLNLDISLIFFWFLVMFSSYYNQHAEFMFLQPDKEHLLLDKLLYRLHRVSSTFKVNGLCIKTEEQSSQYRPLWYT